MSTLLWQRPTWPHFTWDHGRVATALARARYEQGLLLGRLSMVAPENRQLAARDMTAREAAASATLETFASTALKLEVSPAAFEHFSTPLTAEMLQDRHGSLFPDSDHAWRSDVPASAAAPPPPPELLEAELAAFLTWFNAGPAKDDADPVIKAAIGHLWWMTLQPFATGNIVMACLLTDTLLARADQSAERFYSVATQMLQEQAAYELGLERTRKSATDITPWLIWFLGCFTRALQAAAPLLSALLVPATATPKTEGAGFNARQRTMVAMLREEGGSITTTRWAQHAQCSQDSAYRDILDLIAKNVLRKEARGGRSTRYSLVGV